MKFADIPAHEQAKLHLRNMVDSGTLPHALLISGPEGIGKLALARALAQYLQCTDRHAGDSCGRCPSCLQHESFNHADMHYVFPIVKNKAEHKETSDDYLEPWRDFMHSRIFSSWQEWLNAINAGNSRPAIFVEEASSILRIINLSAYSSAMKVVLIWLPEKLGADTANKLLKVIEEPWEDSRFILVSNDPGQILPTIYSRTQRLNLSPLSPAETTRILTSDYGIDTDQATQLARISDGNMCKALELMEQSSDNELMEQLFREIMRKAYQRDVKALKDLSEQCAALGREKNVRLLTYFASMIRENFIYNLQMPQLNRMTASEQAFSSRFSPFINAANVEDIIADLNMAATDISRNANAKIVMFDTLLRLIVYIIRKPE